MSVTTPPPEAPSAGPPSVEARPHPELDEMSPVHRWSNLAGVVLPMIGLVIAIVVGWDRWVDWSALAALAALYALAGFGVTLGFHRLLTHRSFQTSKPVEYAFAILGSMAVQGPVVSWVADHRKHHAHTDEEGDPHSPHVGHEGGLRGICAGLWHAHAGWLMTNQGRADWKRFAPDLYEDPGMRAIGRAFVPLVLLSRALPALAGYLVAGTLAGAATGLLWGGLVRIFFVHHVTWSVNSVCHFFGSRRFDTDDESTNVFWLALPSLGESWHHNHHAFSRSACHGLRWYELDPSGWLILGLERVGLAWDVVKVTPERARGKLANQPVSPL